MRRRHATSPGFYAHYQDLGISSRTMHDFISLSVVACHHIRYVLQTIEPLVEAVRRGCSLILHTHARDKSDLAYGV